MSFLIRRVLPILIFIFVNSLAEIAGAEFTDPFQACINYMNDSTNNYFSACLDEARKSCTSANRRILGGVANGISSCQSCLPDYQEDSNGNCVQKSAASCGPGEYLKKANEMYPQQCTTCPDYTELDPAAVADTRVSDRNAAVDPAAFEKTCPAPAQTAASGCEALPQEIETNCTSTKSPADDACDTEKDTGMNTVLKNANSAARLLNSGAASGINQGCGIVSQLSYAVNGALGAFEINCNLKKKTCMDSCAVVRDKAKKCAETDTKYNALADQAAQTISACQALETKLQDAKTSLGGAQQAASAYSQCADATDGGGGEFCKAYPANPACQSKLAQNCSNATYAASNKICACVGSGINSAACASAKLGSDATSLTAGQFSNDTAKNSLGGGTPDFGSDPSSSELKLDPTAMGDDPGGRSGGGGGHGGGGSGNSIGGASGGHGATAEEKRGGITGFFGSNGSGGGGGFFSGAAKAISQMLGYKQKEKGPDLRNFLPKMNKGINGMRGLANTTGADGLTGPNSDIWLKIKNRYQAQTQAQAFMP